MDIVNVTDLDSFNSIYFGRWFTYNCKQCGTFCKRKKVRQSQGRLLCTLCSQNDSCIKRFGKDNNTILLEARQQYEKENLKNFGCRYTFQRKDIQEKIKQKFNETLGVDNPFQSNDVQLKAKKSLLDKYGVDSYSKTDDYKVKYKKTSIERFGTEHPCKSDNVKDKIKQTCLTKFGVECSLLNEDVIKKIETTNLERYGDVHYINSEACKKVCLEKYGCEKPHPHKYKLNNITFDSFWELCFYMYFKDHNLFIERVTKPYEYQFNGINHYYYPDFNISCGTVEIKGDHFFENGKMINPYDRTQDDLFEAKHQCGINNNVIFLLEKDLVFATDYVVTTYGADIKNNLRS